MAKVKHLQENPELGEFRDEKDVLSPREKGTCSAEMEQKKRGWLVLLDEKDVLSPREKGTCSAESESLDETSTHDSAEPPTIADTDAHDVD